MSTVLPTPSQKSKEQILSFLGGYVRQTMSIRSAGPWGQKNNPVAASPKKGEGGGRARARARPPPLPGALCACGILSTYLSIYIYLPIPLYNIYMYYIYIHLSLSLSLSLFLSRSSFWRGLMRAHVRATKLRI